MNEINRNHVGSKEYSEKSFVGVFHEEQIWHDEEYYKLESCLYDVNNKYHEHHELPREIFWHAMAIYSYLSFSISCHFDSNDSFEIINLSQEQLYERRERLKLIFEGFFQGKMPNNYRT